VGDKLGPNEIRSSVVAGSLGDEYARKKTVREIWPWRNQSRRDPARANQENQAIRFC
jgi:hypothetical protein